MMAPAVVRRITGGGPLLGDIGIELRTMTGVATPVLASFRLLGEMDPAVEGAVRSPIGPLGRFLCLGAMARGPQGAPLPGGFNRLPPRSRPGDASMRV